MITINALHFPVWMLRCSMLAVVVFILYAGFYPFSPMSLPTQDIWVLLCFNATHKVFLFDIIQNLLFFLPLGFIGAIYSVITTQRVRWISILVLGFCLSAFVEITQSYLPMRVPSLLDIALNGISTGLGMLVYVSLTLRSRALLTGQQFKLGILLLCWLLSQLAPWIPSLDAIQLSHSLYQSEDAEALLASWPEILSYGLQGLLVVWLCYCLSSQQFQKIIAALILLFMMGQIITLGHILQIAPLIGLLIAVLLLQLQQIKWILSIFALRLILGMSIAFLSLFIMPWQISADFLEDATYSMYLQYVFWGSWLFFGVFSEKH
jgi:glycopeptide antibiotics resistance protein